MPGFIHRSARTGRADLLYFLRQSNRDALAASAPIFGYQAPKPQQETPEEPSTVFDDLPDVEQQNLPETTAEKTESHNSSGQRFFRLRERAQLGQEPVTRAPERLLKAKPFTGSIAASLAPRKKVQSPIPPPLSPWPRIWPFLRAVLGAMSPSSAPDLARIVRSLAQGEVLTRLPQLPRPGWANRAQVILDLDLSIHYFWQDFYGLTERLLGLRGRIGLEVLCFEDGPLGPCTDFEPERRERQRPYRLPEAGTPILILSDLGLLSKRADAWLALGRQFRQDGCRPMVLMPCPERYWRGDLAEVFQLVVWDHGRRYSKSRCGCRQQAAPDDMEQPDPGQENLLAIAATAVRVESGLLRSLRLLLPAGQVDVGTEAAVWQHEEVEADLLAFRVKPEVVEKYAALLKEKLQGRDAHLFQQALARIQAFHAALPPEIQFEEEMSAALLTGEQPAEDTLDFMWQVAATLEDSSVEYPYASHLKAWVQRLAQRQQKAYWRSEAGEPIAIALTRGLLEHFGKAEDIPFPAGFDVNRVAWVLNSNEPKKDHQNINQIASLDVSEIKQEVLEKEIQRLLKRDELKKYNRNKLSSADEPETE